MAPTQRQKDIEAAIEFLARDPMRISKAYWLHRNDGTGHCIAHKHAVAFPCLTWRMANQAHERHRPPIPRPREAT